MRDSWIDHYNNNLKQLKQETHAQIPDSGKLPVACCRTRDAQRFALSYSQERLWFLHQFEPNHYMYNIPLALHLKGPINRNALRLSLNELIARHEILRTSFVEVNGQPQQVIKPCLQIPLPVVEIPYSSKGGPQDQLQALLTKEAQHQFDLRQCPLLHIKLLQLGEAEYIFILVLHHIIADGWSVGLMLGELSALYKNALNGTLCSQAGPPARYTDYVIQQRQWLQGETSRRLLDYWTAKLAGPIPMLELPTDHPRPAVQSFQGTSESFELSQNLTEALKNYCRQENVTLFMALLTAVKILLYRYSGQTDIAVGTPIANRNRFQVEQLLGCFVNTLVLRSNLSNSPSVHELLRQVRQTTLEAYDHQDLPLEKLVEELQPKRHLSHSPIFQVMFAYQNTPTSNLEIPGVITKQLKVEKETAIFDLALFVNETDNKLSGFIEYSTSIFDSCTIRRMLAHYQVLLENMIAYPHQRISELGLLSRKERDQVLVEWNDTKVPYAQNKCIHELFVEQVKRTPNAIAALYNQESLTYSQLDRRANQLAHYLMKKGVRPNRVVGICLRRSFDMIVSLLGALKAGAAYVPLDPGFPPRRRLSMLQDAKAHLLLTDSALAEGVHSEGLDIVCLNQNRMLIEQEPNITPQTDVRSRDLAYIIYTSGSTGRPKGIKVCHQSVINLIECVNREFSVGSADRMLFITSLCFDLSVYDVFGILAAGASIHIASDADCKSPQALLKILSSEPVTFWDSAPAALQQIVPFLNTDSYPTRHSPLRLVFLSGDWIPVTLPDTIRESFPKSRITSLGGATEATVWSNYYPIGKVQADWVSIPYGKPIQNAQYYILDDHLNPCPIGVPGQLYIGGDCLCIGYIDEQQTAERFIAHPFSKQAEARLYNTGDMARFGPDGNIEFLGRLDHQVKIRGFRIELGEVEAVLCEHPNIREVVVLAKEDATHNKRLVAYIVPEPTCKIDKTSLRSFLKKQLPDYMLPSVYVVLDSLPLTHNRKVDRKALPEPDIDRSNSNQAYVAPRTALEKTLAGIWQEVLGIDMIGVNDNYFELGGHSLLAIRIISLFRDRCGISLTLHNLFDSPTIAKLAEIAGSLFDTDNVIPASVSNLVEEIDKLSEEEVAIALSADSSDVPVFRLTSHHDDNAQ